MLAVAAAALAAWLLPSQFSAERYRHRLEAGLEAFLHRPARFGSASFQLLPQPRFTLENVVIHEEPAFGPEPIARIDRVYCDLRWSSIWRRRLEFDGLRLVRSSFNIVRNARGEWNFDEFLVKSGVTGKTALDTGYVPPLPFDIEIDDARLNYKEGDHKKIFAIVGLQGRMNFDPAERRIGFNLKGNPVRMDSPSPPPGLMELSGEWGPGPDLRGTFDALVRTQGTLISDWVSLITGTHPGIYGVVDAEVRLQGSLRSVKIEAQSSVSRLHRQDLLPPADPMPIRIRLRAGYEFAPGRVVIESAEVSFFDSNLHVSGTVDDTLQSPDVDLVVALEHSQWADWSRLARRLWRLPDHLSLEGRLDGLLTVQGRKGNRSFGGSIAGRATRLVTAAGAFPISDLSFRVDQNGARMEPVILSIAPRFVIALDARVVPAQAAGKRGKVALPPSYELKVDVKNADLREAVRFARALGIPSAMSMDAQGLGNSAATLQGVAWPPARPNVLVRADIRSARFLVPGLTEPLNVPRARLQLSDRRIVIDSLTAVIGSSILTGRVEHSGPRENPWRFDLRANSLSVEEGAAWFDALGHRPKVTLLERIPGLGSITARRTVASALFTAVNARGRFSTPLLAYRALRLRDFEASLDLSGRILGLTGVSFRAGKGRGEACAQLNLSASPAEIAGELKVSDVKIETLASRLPPALRNARGSLSGVAQFRTRGLSRSEMSAYLEAEGTARLEKVLWGEFDPVEAMARNAFPAAIDRERHQASLQSAEIVFGIKDKKVSVMDQSMQVNGATMAFNGTWILDGPLDLEVSADFRRQKRALPAAGSQHTVPPSTATIRLTGPLGDVHMQPLATAARARRPAVQ